MRLRFCGPVLNRLALYSCAALTIAGTILPGSASAVLLNDGPIPEGSSATVSFSPVVGGTTYEIDCLDDGNFEFTASSALCFYDDNGTMTARGRMTDGGGSSTITTSVDVTNVPPDFTLTNAGPVDIGVPVAVNITGVTDPSGADTMAGFSGQFDCDDDSTFEAFGMSTTCTFATDGTHTVNALVFDKDGEFMIKMTTVTVNAAAPVPALSPLGIGLAVLALCLVAAAPRVRREN